MDKKYEFKPIRIDFRVVENCDGDIDKLVKYFSSIKTDVSGHLEMLKKYASECKHITEMGVRKHFYSTIALLAGNPDVYIGYDIDDQGVEDFVRPFIRNKTINFKFFQKDTTKISIQPTELLFIDTWHTYIQLKTELILHAKNVTKYIILHDTYTYGEKDEKNRYMSNLCGKNTKHGLKLSIQEFLSENSNWEFKEEFTHCNGLTILERK